MHEPLLLGLDIGTSSAKAILISPRKGYIGHQQKNYAINSPRAGWAEQEPQVWVDAVVQATRHLVRTARVNPAQIEGIGLSGQMHGTVCVSHNGTPLRPAIIWADQRTADQVAYVYHVIGRKKLAEWTGNPLATGFMLASWLWLREHEPLTIRECQWLMLPKDYVRLILTGEIGAEPSDASSTLLFDPLNRQWSESMLSTFNLDGGVLPRIQPSTAIAGKLLPDMADAMGLCAGIPVIYGGSDQAMQALGNGVVDPGVLSSTIGTGGQLFAPTDSFVVDQGLRMHSFCHILPNRWHLETAILSAGLSLKWLKENFLGDSASYQTLADVASTVPPGAGGVIFLPYLLGERTPHMDPQARGCLIGLNKFHDKRYIVRAVMEGVVFALKQGLSLMRDLHVPIDRVVASGGAAVHPLWIQLQADIYNYPVYRTKTVEAAAFGAALLAGVGVGVYADAAQAVSAEVAWHEQPVNPNPAHKALYDKRYNQFEELYPALMPVYHRLSDLSV